jgi:hypothetical protein
VHADEIVIEGERGELRMTTFGDDAIEVRSASGVERHPYANPIHIQQPMIESVVRTLLGEGSCESTGDSGARTQAVMDAALSGYYGGRDRAFWCDPESWPGRSGARPRREGST